MSENNEIEYETPTIKEIEAAGKDLGIDIRLLNGWLNGQVAYRIISTGGEYLITKSNLIMKYMRGDLS